MNQERSGSSRYIMVDRGKRTVGSPDLSAGISKPFKGLWRGDLMDEMSVDIKEGVSFTGVDDVVVKDFVV